MTLTIKKISDQNNDNLSDRAFIDLEAEISVVEYQKSDGSFSRNNPSLDGKVVRYLGREYRAFQRTPDSYIREMNQRDGKFCLVPVQEQKSCINKPSTVSTTVTTKELTAVLPTLYEFVIEGCPPCGPVWEQLKLWEEGKWCRLRIKKVFMDKGPLKPEENPPGFKGKLPYVALRYPDGNWKTFKQWQDTDFEVFKDYFYYLFDNIEECQMPR